MALSNTLPCRLRALALGLLLTSPIVAEIPAPVQRFKETFSILAQLAHPPLSASAEHRWKLLQEIGGLADFPDEATAIESGLEGSGMPRTVIFKFRLPRQAATLWLLSCPGQVTNLRNSRNKAALRPLGAWVYDFPGHNDDRYLLKNDRLPPARGLTSALNLWAKSDRPFYHCTMHLFGRADDTIQIELSTWGSVHIAD